MRVRLRFVAVLGCTSCTFDVPPANHLNATELVMVRHSVELGGLFPERVGPSFAGMEAAPIAEVLPGDRLRLEAVVVDADGRRLPAAELETLWLQCGFSCARPWLTFSDDLFDVPCAELEPYTTDDYCLLGTGDGGFELDVPELGASWMTSLALGLGPHMSFYGVVAWDGRTAEDCWATRRSDRSELDGCGFIYHNVEIGPIWAASVHAAALGLETPVDPSVIPSWLLSQPANRIPQTPALTVWIDGELATSGVPPLPPITATPGARIEIALAFDPFSQSLQRRFQTLTPMNYDAWKLVSEQLYSRTETSGAIRSDSETPVEGDGSFSYTVDTNATPGSSRVLILFVDSREAGDLSMVEFEVR